MWRSVLLGLVLLALSIGLSHAAALPSPAAVPPPAPAPSLVPLLALSAPGGPQPVTATLSIELSITGAVDLGAFEFDLVYDPALVQVSGLSLGPFLGVVEGCDPQASRCAVALGPQAQGDATALGAYSYGALAGPSGDGLLAVIVLQPTGVSGISALHIAKPLLASTGGTPSVPDTRDTSVALAGEALRHTYLPLTLRRRP